MKYILLICLCILAVIFLALFAVDFYYYLVNRYCRFHIGRWKSKSEWEEAVYNICIKWSKKSPTVKISDNNRYMLIDMISKKYRSSSIQSWQSAAVILGLIEKGDKNSVEKAIRAYIDENGNWRKQPQNVDFGMLSYALLKGVENPFSIKPAMDTIVRLIKDNLDNKGLIAYTHSKSDPERYVDTLGLVCPFLALYAKIYGEPYYEKMALYQLEYYHNNGLLLDTSLPNHAVNSETNLPLGVFGWGRGVAWYTLGLVDTYYEIDNDEYKNEIKSWINEAAQSYMKFQRSDGGFGSILQRHNTYDSSATAALAYFYQQCAILFDEKGYVKIVDSALDKLKSCTRITGKIDFCQGDTKGIGVFAQTYDIMPFAQGLALRTIEMRRKVNFDGQ